MPSDFAITNCHGLKLAWDRQLEGGGRSFGQDYIYLVRHLFGHVDRVYEFCAGPGYIAFSLLAHGLCDELVLSDVNPRAIEAMKQSVAINGLEDRVTVYESDGLESIPAEERWDLVVSNPPHFKEQARGDASLITDDPGWKLHRDFYARVGGFLAPGGSLLIQENSRGSDPEDFFPMIEAGGLTHIRTLWYPGGWSPTAFFYFLWVKQAMPGLTITEEPTVAVLPLREVAAAPLELAPDRPCRVQLVNETDRPVQPQLQHESGARPLWLPFTEIAAGAEAPLPLMALRVGEFEVRDKAEGTTLARLVVCEPEGSE
jgi:16S rRNA G966 N2-methylase RsmD